MEVNISKGKQMSTSISDIVDFINGLEETHSPHCDEPDDEAFLEWLCRDNGERRNHLFTHDVPHHRRIAARIPRKNTTAGREDHVGLICERLDDNLPANSLCFADQPDDRVFGLRHVRPGGFRRRRLLRPPSR